MANRDAIPATPVAKAGLLPYESPVNGAEPASSALPVTPTQLNGARAQERRAKDVSFRVIMPRGGAPTVAKTRPRTYVDFGVF